MYLWLHLNCDFLSDRQPDLFQGVTLDEYNALRASGKIDAYGFSTKGGPLVTAAASPNESAASPALPAAGKQGDAGGIISLSSGYVDPLG